jgi:hypothetical protein
MFSLQKDNIMISGRFGDDEKLIFEIDLIAGVDFEINRAIVISKET